jgi:hypothetical protein
MRNFKRLLLIFSLFIGFVALSICGILLWMNYKEKKLIKASLTKASKAENISNIIKSFGEPYAIYPHTMYEDGYGGILGRQLMYTDEDISNTKVYAFVLQKTPPVFLVVKVSTIDGKILKIGIDYS